MLATIAGSVPRQVRGYSADTHGNDIAFARRMANGRTNRELANALLGIIV